MFHLVLDPSPHCCPLGTAELFLVFEGLHFAECDMKDLDSMYFSLEQIHPLSNMF